MINEANTLDLEDLDDIQDLDIDSPGYEESIDEGTQEPVETESDFDLAKELLTLQGISDKNKIDMIDDENIFGSMIMDSAFRLVVPIIFIYGIYVLIHGEISLGGGFQAGALLASAYLLDRIIPSFASLIGYITEEIALLVAGVGVFIYAFTGILPMFNGGNFLEYGKLPFAAEAVADLHSTGILMIEIGVTLAVMGVVIAILELVLERTDI